MVTICIMFSSFVRRSLSIVLSISWPFHKVPFDFWERLFYNESKQELAFDFNRKGDMDGPVYPRGLKIFYASVECVDRGLDPLTTNLVVADESRKDGTICLAVSPSMKAYGISGRARLFEVKQRVQAIKESTGKEIQYIIARPRMQRYLDVSADIYSLYLKYIAPEHIHTYGVDEVFMDVTNYLKMYEMSAQECVKLGTTFLWDI